MQSQRHSSQGAGEGAGRENQGTAVAAPYASYLAVFTVLRAQCHIRADETSLHSISSFLFRLWFPTYVTNYTM